MHRPFRFGPPAPTSTTVLRPRLLEPLARRFDTRLTTIETGASGDARFFRSSGAKPPTSPVVALMPTPTGKGYWLVTAAGAVLGYGDATSYGQGSGGKHVIGAAPNATGRGYWLIAEDKTLLPFGDAVVEP